jgi:hypothetical protein
MYTFFVVLHIISSGVVVGLMAMAIIGTSLRKKVKGTIGELGAIRSGAIMAPIMANSGSIGLLVTGVVMTIMQYQSSFFAFSTVPWLAMMQTDFVVIMAISGAILMPNGKKILAKVSAELAGPNAAKGASEELRTLVNKQYALTLVVAFLLFIAIYLGESKAMMWVTAQ